MNETNPTPTQQETLEPPDRIWIEFRRFRSRAILVGEPSWERRSENDIEYVRAAVAGPRGDAESLVKKWIATLQDESRVTDEDAEDLTLRIIAFAATSSPAPAPAESDLYRVASRVLRWLYATMNPKLPIDRSLLKVTQFEIHAELERAILDTHAANVRARIAPAERTRVEGE